MDSLKKTGKYTIDKDMNDYISSMFIGGYSSEEAVNSVINEIFDKTGYVIDTHTAVAASAYTEYRKNTNDETVSVIVSTASPYKFTRSVLGAIEGKNSDEEDFVLIDRLSEISNMQIPKAVEDIRNAKVLHDTVCEIDEMKNEIAKFLNL